MKEVLLSDDLTAYGQFVLRPNGQELGPRLGRDVQGVFAAAREGQWARNADGTVTVAGHTLSDSEFELALNPVEGTTAAALRANDALVALDTAVSPELASEGIARDVVRAIQAERKNQGLDVTDRIRLSVTAGAEILEAVEAHRTYVCEQVLAAGDPDLIASEAAAVSADGTAIDAGQLQIHLAKAE